MGTARLLWVTALRELGKAVARWLVGALLVGAVFFSPSGVDPRDVVHHLRGSLLVAMVVAALATAWIAPSVRRALVAPGTDILRALPYHRGVLGGALFLGVLVAAAPVAVLVVAGGGPGVAYAIAITSAVAALQPVAPSVERVRTWASRGARLAVAGGSVALCMRVPLATSLVAGPFSAWALAGGFRDARADRGAPLRLVFGGPPSISVPWSVLVQGGRSDVGALVRGVVLVMFSAWLARRSLAHFDDPGLPSAVAALAAAGLTGPALVLSWTRAARTLRALPLEAGAHGGLAARAAVLFGVVPFWAVLLVVRSLSAALVAGATFVGCTLVLAADRNVGDGGRADERLPVVAALAVASSAIALGISPWGPAVALVAMAAVRRVWRRAA